MFIPFRRRIVNHESEQLDARPVAPPATTRMVGTCTIDQNRKIQIARSRLYQHRRFLQVIFDYQIVRNLQDALHRVASYFARLLVQLGIFWVNIAGFFPFAIPNFSTALHIVSTFSLGLNHHFLDGFSRFFSSSDSKLLHRSRLRN